MRFLTSVSEHRHALSRALNMVYVQAAKMSSRHARETVRWLDACLHEGTTALVKSYTRACDMQKRVFAAFSFPHYVWPCPLYQLSVVIIGIDERRREFDMSDKQGGRWGCIAVSCSMPAFHKRSQTIKAVSSRRENTGMSSTCWNSKLHCSYGLKIVIWILRDIVTHLRQRF